MAELGTLKPVSEVTEADDTVNERLIWVDLEMSGLEVDKERIIEMAVSVTDGKCTKVAQGPNIIINQSKKLMDDMDPWCVNTHGKSGLTKLVLDSKISESDCQQQMIDFIKEYTNKGKSPMAGNSIYMDKMFLMKYMPEFCEYVHFRLVDVSTIKELSKRWYPDVAKQAPKKADKHRAKDDILDSINELNYYRSAMFISPN